MNGYRIHSMDSFIHTYIHNPLRLKLNKKYWSHINIRLPYAEKQEVLCVYIGERDISRRTTGIDYEILFKEEVTHTEREKINTREMVMSEMTF